MLRTIVTLIVLLALAYGGGVQTAFGQATKEDFEEAWGKLSEASKFADTYFNNVKNALAKHEEGALDKAKSDLDEAKKQGLDTNKETKDDYAKAKGHYDNAVKERQKTEKNLETSQRERKNVTTRSVQAFKEGFLNEDYDKAMKLIENPNDNDGAKDHLLKMNGATFLAEQRLGDSIFEAQEAQKLLDKILGGPE